MEDYGVVILEKIGAEYLGRKDFLRKLQSSSLTHVAAKIPHTLPFPTIMRSCQKQAKHLARFRICTQTGGRRF